MNVTYLGQLKCSATHKSGSTIQTDAPADVGGEGSTFSPTDLVATALASCIATTLGLYATRKGYDLKGMKVDVEKIMGDSGGRRIEQLPIEIWIPGSFSDEQKASLEKIAHACPVHKSLHPDVKVDITIHWS